MKQWADIAPGLPTLRLSLVALIVFFQSAEVSTSWLTVMATPLWLVQVLAFPALFVVTGFLLSASLRRNPRKTVVRRRALRVLPPVVIAIAGCALGLGPLLTSRPLASYFADPGTWAYFANLVAVPVYALPGVFEFNNAAQTVNPVVTVFPSYALLLATGVAAPSGDRRATLFVIAIASATASAAIAARIFDFLPGDPRSLLRIALAGPGFGMLLAGWVGILIDKLRDKVKLNGVMLAVAAMILLAVSLRGNPGWWDNPVFWIVITPVLAYIVIWLAMTPLPWARVAVLAEPLLWPILLLAYPLQQAVIDRGPREQTVVVNFAIVLVPLVIAAALSWRLTGRLGGSSNTDGQLVQVAQSLTERPLRARRSLRSRLSDAAMPLALIVVVGLVMVIAMAMLFLALSR